MAVDFSESANALINDVLKGHEDRNNLGVEVENGSSHIWHVNQYVDHGATFSFKGSSILSPVDPKGSNVRPTIYEVGLVAQGAGCNIGIILSSPLISEKFVVIAATPSNKSNYVKLYYGTETQKTSEKYWDLADDGDKHYSDDGWASMSAGGVTIKVLISGASPAVAFIEIVED